MSSSRSWRLLGCVFLLAVPPVRAAAQDRIFPNVHSFELPEASPRVHGLVGRIFSARRGDSQFGREAEAEVAVGENFPVIALRRGERPVTLGFGTQVYGRFSLGDRKSALISNDWVVGLNTTAHNLDIGIDYRRPLSRTRRTFLSFNTGSTVAESEVSGRRVQAVGSASLVHYVRRTWTGLFEYRRRLHYVDGFDRPLFGDALTAGFSGLLSRSMELSARTGYTAGTIGLSTRAPRFESYTGSVRLRRALSRKLAGYVEGLFYHYSFDEDAVRPPGLPRAFRFRCRCS